MKVLSIREPFASLIKEKVKFIETRSWKTTYRGELYIQASKKILTKKEMLEYFDLLNLLKDTNFKYGYIIIKCNLVDCKLMTKKFIEEIKNNFNEYLCGEYKEGRYAWILEDIEVLTKPILAKGQLGIWNYKNN